MVGEIETAIDPDALFQDLLVILGIYWPFPSFWHVVTHFSGSVTFYHVGSREGNETGNMEEAVLGGSSEE